MCAMVVADRMGDGRVMRHGQKEEWKESVVDVRRDEKTEENERR